jgi:hypothetical protein
VRPAKADRQWGDKLSDLLNSHILPFSSLSLSLPSRSSSFGKPPADPLNIYPRVTTPTQFRRQHYIPPPPDPFFLPPPFIPSHPHLRDLCDQSIEYLRDRHAILEAEVQSFIAKKSDEMRKLEDTVRKEVEVLWQKYANVPGVAAELERSRSRSDTREADAREKKREIAVKFAAPDKGPLTSSETPTPKGLSRSGSGASSLAQAMSPTPAGGSSLLSASISANHFHAPPPRPSVEDKDEVTRSISELTKKYDTKSDARAVAMSYVFSSLDEAMAERAEAKRPGRTQTELEVRQTLNEDPSEVVENYPEGAKRIDKDSWIDAERRLLSTADGDADGTTPKPAKKELKDGTPKGKRAVKFSEPEPTTEEGKDVSAGDKGRDDNDDGDDGELRLDGPSTDLQMTFSTLRWWTTRKARSRLPSRSRIATFPELEIW